MARSRESAGRRFLARPSSRSGRLAVALLGTSIVLLLLLIVGALLSPEGDPDGFLDYLAFGFLVVTLVGAAATGIAAGVAAGYALARQHERSWLAVIALLWGLAVLYLGAVELLGDEEPGGQPPRGARTEFRELVVLRESGRSRAAVRCDPA